MSTTLLLVILVIVLLFGFGGYSYYQTRYNVGHALVVIAVIIIVLILAGVIPAHAQTTPVPPGGTDWQGIVLVITAIGTVITGVIAALANYNASKAKVASDESKIVSQGNTVKLEKIEGNTNSLQHAMAAVAQTDANARYEVAKSLPAAVVAPTMPATPANPIPVEVVNTEPVKVTQTPKAKT